MLAVLHADMTKITSFGEIREVYMEGAPYALKTCQKSNTHMQFLKIHQYKKVCS